MVTVLQVEQLSSYKPLKQAACNAQEEKLRKRRK